MLNCNGIEIENKTIQVLFSHKFNGNIFFKGSFMSVKDCKFLFRKHQNQTFLNLY